MGSSPISVPPALARARAYFRLTSSPLSLLYWRRKMSEKDNMCPPSPLAPRERSSAGQASREVAPPMRCYECNAPRQGDTCHKCGAVTSATHAGWEEPRLPPYQRIVELAREVGYAVGVHGSQERDFDLIAAPWTTEAVQNLRLVEHIANNLPARIVGGTEHKPLGRVAFSLQMDGWYKLIDLSVCPRVSDENPKGEDPEGLSAEGIPARSSERGDALPLSSHGEEKKGGGNG